MTRCDICGNEIGEGQEVYNDDDGVYCSDECYNEGENKDD